MPSGSQVHRGEEQLGLILGQVGSVRSRLNGLAIQQGLFESLSLIVGTGAIVFLAAFLLEPLKFLSLATVLGAVLIVGLVRAVQRAYRMHASSERAALVADQRAGLKGRLATVVWLARNPPSRGQLWPYLLEDTLTLRDEFAPARVEPRRVSRSLYGLLVYCLLAALVVTFALMNRRSQPAAKAADTELDIDVSELDVRPIDPDLGSQVEVIGDPAAMRKLADKVAAAGESQGQSNGAMGELMDRARDLAGNVQDRLTGQPRSRMRLRVTDTGAGGPGYEASGGSRHGLTSANSGHPGLGAERAGSERSPANDSLRGPMAQRDRNGNGNGNGLNAPQGGRRIPGGEAGTHDSSEDPLAQPDGDSSAGGGSAHGSGSDPAHLFGQAEEPPLGSEGFEIMIEARPAEHGPKGASQSYLPPKVRAALNSRQYPDEPIARSTVPDEDRTAIKRVFER